MSKIPDTLYGKEAQVDWGEKNMTTRSGHWKKVYFFVMILSRSRHKFVCFQDIPFTSASTVYAHHLAFEFFGGVPERILYDQDVKLIVSENLGDYILTKEMESFRKSAGFIPIFCKAADPQSKGKVENVVKYVKRNFLGGRVFTTIEELNQQVLTWLARTGNGHRHATTKLIPAEEFDKEKGYLRPYTAKIKEPSPKGRLYTVRRDNTISYHSCYYQLPNGIYNGDDTKVRLVEISDNEIEIYDNNNGTFIISYTVSAIKGRHIVKKEVMTTDKRDVTKEENLLVKYYEGKPMQEKLLLYMASILEDRPRYYKASIRALWELFPQLPESIAPVLLETLIKNKTLNAFDAFKIASALLKRHHLPPLKKMMSRYGRRGRRQAPAANLEPLKSDITSYDILIEELSQN